MSTSYLNLLGQISSLNRRISIYTPNMHVIYSEVGTAPLFSSGATSAAVFLIAEAEAPLLFSANSEKRQRRYIWGPVANSASVKAINLPLPLLQKNFKEHSFKLQLRNVNNKIKLLSSIPLHFKSKILMNLFIQYNTALPSSAAVERLFSVGKDVLKPKRSGLTDEHFEMLFFLKGTCEQFIEL